MFAINLHEIISGVLYIIVFSTKEQEMNYQVHHETAALFIRIRHENSSYIQAFVEQL